MEESVKGVMIKHVITCDPEITLQDAAKLMKKKNLTCLIVIKNKVPIGIVTERDIMFKAVANNLDSSKILIKEIMTSPIKTISPEDKIYYANSILLKEGIKRLPVVKDNRLVGIITQKDLLEYFTKLRKTLALDKFGESIKSS
jgi:CBS domain-containing protein